jgi:hypothetical protein
MAGITTYLSILTLNVNDSTPPSKDNVWPFLLKGISDNLLFAKDPS